MIQQKQLFSIQEISRKIGVPKSTLRFWEKELNGRIIPLRTRGGQRRYTAAHLDLLTRINKMRKQGMSLIEVKEQLGSTDSSGRIDNAGLQRIDLLAQRVGEVVKAEVFRFLEEEN